MSDELKPFSIDNRKVFEVIIQMLIDIAASQRTLEQLYYKDAKTTEDLNASLNDLKKSKEFHKEEVYKYLFSRFADLRDILPPNVHLSEE